MRTTIDAAGRIVVPKALRTRAGLTAGVEVLIEEQGDGLLVKAATPPARLGEASDGPVIVPDAEPGRVLTDDMVREILESVRR